MNKAISKIIIDEKLKVGINEIDIILQIAQIDVQTISCQNI